MTTPRSHRRDFLKGKAAARAIEHLAQQAAESLDNSLAEGASAPRPATDHYLLKYSRRAMACEFEVWLNAGQDARGAEAAIAALDCVDQLEAQLTVYRETRELSLLNRTAAQGPQPVESQLFELLRRCVALWQETDGAFDITSTPLSELWGFHRRAGRLPAPQEIAACLPRIGSQHLQLDEGQQAIAFAIAGLQLNLGAIGKGYALDRATAPFTEAEVSNYLMHGGNSSVLARGSNASRQQGGWAVGVRNALRPAQYLGEIVLRDRALSTSGSGTQFFLHEGKRYGHILDPRTGWPAEGVLSVTVVAPTAAEAEAFSTAFYVLGPEKTAEICHQRPELGCLMQVPTERSGELVTHRWNLNDGEWCPADSQPPAPESR